MLLNVFSSDLIFENTDKTLVVTSDENGKTRLEWELGGFPGDVEAFFDELHARGIEKGQTLANLLDVRENPSTEPEAASLPATINPLEFVIKNVLRHNAFLVRIKVNGIGEDAAGLEWSSILRKLVPPHTAMLILAELSPTQDHVTMNGPGSEQSTGYEETVEMFDGMNTVTETVPTSQISEAVSLKQIGGHCK